MILCGMADTQTQLNNSQAYSIGWKMDRFLAKLPAVNSAVVEVWQRDISAPEGESYSPGYVIYMDCKLDEGLQAMMLITHIIYICTGCKKSWR